MSAADFQSVRAVLFDAVGTLLLPREPVAATYCRLARPWGSQMSEAQVASRFAAALAADGETHHTSEQIERQRWQKVVAQSLTDLSVEHVESLFQQLWQYYAQPESWRLAADVPEMWQRLTAAGFLVGIASNFDARLESVRRGHPPLDETPWCFVSSRLGYRKPSPLFFQAIELQLQLAPDQIMLIGDDHDHDFRAAQAAGWQAVLLDRRNPSRPGQVASLAELVV